MQSGEIQKTKNRQSHTTIFAKHVYGNLYGVDSKLLIDPNFISKLVVEAARLGNLHILEMISRKFNSYNGSEGGVSVIALIEESHISIHTWPEGEYATVDVYSCGAKAEPRRAFNYLVSILKPKDYKAYNVDRGAVV